MLARPVGLFKREPLADVLDNPMIGRQDQRSNQGAVGPHGKGEPIDHTVHGVEIDFSTSSGLDKRWRQRGWGVDAEFLGCDDRNAIEAANEQFIIRWRRKIKIAITQRLQLFSS